MRTETITRTIYTATELQEAHSEGFERAHERYRADTYRDPAWADEHQQSTDAVLALLANAPRIDGPRRVTAWVEHNVLAPLRIPFGMKNARRRELARYGSYYHPGKVRPCPFTGYYVDDALLEVVAKEARAGSPPAEIARRVQEESDRLWEQDLEGQAGTEGFLSHCEANELEFLADGTQV